MAAGKNRGYFRKLFGRNETKNMIGERYLGINEDSPLLKLWFSTSSLYIYITQRDLRLSRQNNLSRILFFLSLSFSNIFRERIFYLHGPYIKLKSRFYLMSKNKSRFYLWKIKVVLYYFALFFFCYATLLFGVFF